MQDFSKKLPNRHWRLFFCWDSNNFLKYNPSNYNNPFVVKLAIKGHIRVNKNRSTLLRWAEPNNRLPYAALGSKNSNDRQPSVATVLITTVQAFSRQGSSDQRLRLRRRCRLKALSSRTGAISSGFRSVGAAWAVVWPILGGLHLMLRASCASWGGCRRQRA